MNETNEILDRLFRKNSKARKAAEILLDGDPHSRTEIASEVAVSPSTIPRVVSMLEGAGFSIEKTVDDDGRGTVFQSHVLGRASSGGTDKFRLVGMAVEPSGVVVGYEAGKRSGQARFTFFDDGTVEFAVGDKSVRLG